MVKHTIIRYKIAQNVRSRRLKRGYTLKALADKTGIKYHMLLKYEQGAYGIPTGELRKIANALSDKVGILFPRRKVLRENNCFDEDRIQKIYDIMGKYIQAGERESCKAIYALTQSIRAQKESNAKAARIKMARSMLEAGYTTITTILID